MKMKVFEIIQAVKDVETIGKTLQDHYDGAIVEDLTDLRPTAQAFERMKNLVDALTQTDVTVKT